MKKQIIFIITFLVLIFTTTAGFQVVTWGYSKPSKGIEAGSNWIIGGGGACTTVFICTSYANCSVTNTKTCLVVSDVGTCGTEYTGDLSDYDGTCDYCDDHPELEMCQVNKMWQIAIILLPSIFGFFCLLGGIFLSQDHVAFKIGMYIMSLGSVLGSLYLGSTVIATTNETVQTALGRTTYWIGIMFGVVIFYFLIYTIYQLVRKSAQEKQAKLKY